VSEDQRTWDGRFVLMSCVLPPELEDRDLLAYLDGQTTRRVLAHLEQCAHCRERANRLAQLQTQLTAHLYRADCPQPAELGEYHLNLLPAGRAAEVAAHLAGCPRCRQEVAQLQAYLGSLAPDLEPGLLDIARERVRVLVAQLVSGWAPGGLAP